MPKPPSHQPQEAQYVFSHGEIDTLGGIVALPGAVGALMVAVVEAPFPTALMPGLGGVHRTAAGQRPAARRAVGVAPVTRRTDRKEATAPAAGLLAEGLVHGVGVSGRPPTGRRNPNRGTTIPTGSVCRRARRSRGSGGPVRTLTYVCVHSYAIRNTESTPRQGLWTLPQVWTHTTRPHLLAKPPRGRFRSPPVRSSWSHGFLATARLKWVRGRVVKRRPLCLRRSTKQ